MWTLQDPLGTTAPAFRGAFGFGDACTLLSALFLNPTAFPDLVVPLSFGVPPVFNMSARLDKSGTGLQFALKVGRVPEGVFSPERAIFDKGAVPSAGSFSFDD